jgi:RNA polymerase sigma-70 factor (ECF subfamily)
MTTAPSSVSTNGRMTQPGVAATGTERDLVTRAQRGDVGAFEALYHATSGRVFGLCLRMSGDRERATELLQDVFVRIWERINSYRGDSAFSTWVHRLAVNVVLEKGRADSRREARVGLGEGSEVGGRRSDSWSLASSPKDDIDNRIDLDAAIAMLPPGARKVFVLHDIEGYQHNEIAQMTGLAEGTLRAQLHRARRILMEALNR